MTTGEAWRRCSSCKQPIELGATYWVCNVSTCNRKRTGLVFCSVTCWEVHLPEANHRETWAVEKTAPEVAEPRTSSDPKARERSRKPTATGQRRIVREVSASPVPETAREILIVASRLKDYIRAKSGFNTSDGRHERKTVLERDIPDASR